MNNQPETPFDYSVDLVQKNEALDLFRPFGGFPDKTELVCCTKLLRKVPGRREVYEGNWRKKEVIVKLFLDKRRAATHSKREMVGLFALQERGIRAPRPLFYGKGGNDIHVVVLEKIADSRSVKEILFSSSSLVQSKWLFKVFEQLAELHRHGVVQHDLHLGNFLAQGESLYVLDPAEMQFKSGSVAQRQSLRQLVYLGADIVHLGRDIFEECLRHYARARNWHFNEKTLGRLFIKSGKQRKRGIEKKLKKYQRSNSLHKKLEEKKFIAIVRRDFCLGDENSFFADIDRYYEKSPLVPGHGNCGFQPVRQFSWHGKEFFIIRFQKRSLWKFWLKTEARVQWLAAHRALLSNISSLIPVAFVEVKSGCKKGFSYFVTEADLDLVQGKSV